MRVYLSGHMLLHNGARIVESRAFPGRQGRQAFAFLAIRHRDPVAKDELAEALWGDALPPAWDTALSAIVSKLRNLLGRLGPEAATALRSDGGCYTLELPPGTWIDQEVAFDQLHLAEASLAAGNFPGVYGPSAIARHILQRPFLSGADGAWLDARRERLRFGLVRALECRGEFYIWNGEHNLAAEAGLQAVALAPFRESAYRMLMRAHVAGGNSAEALRVYESCRALLAEELGVSPSEPTKKVREEILSAL